MRKSFNLTDGDCATVLRHILNEYEAVLIPRGCGKSMISRTLRMIALSRAIEVLEEKGEK